VRRALSTLTRKNARCDFKYSGKNKGAKFFAGHSFNDSRFNPGTRQSSASPTSLLASPSCPPFSRLPTAVVNPDDADGEGAHAGQASGARAA